MAPERPRRGPKHHPYRSDASISTPAKPTAPPTPTPPLLGTSSTPNRHPYPPSANTSRLRTTSRDPHSPIPTPTNAGAPVSMGPLLPALGLTPAAVWTSLSDHNTLTCDLSLAGARAISPRSQTALLLTPAAHLIQAMHGSSDLAVAQTQSRVLWQSVKENTRTSYGRGIIAYLAWCEDLGLPEHFRFPTAINILLLYLQKDMSTLRPGTIDKRAHALQYWHRVQRMPWALAKGDTRTLQKAAKIEGLLPLEKRRPVRLNDLKAMVSHHQPNDNAHVAILAAALLAFFAMCRPGEVTVRSASEPHSDRARWAHIVEHPPMTADGVASFALRLPSEKVHGRDGWDRIAAEQRQMPELCPVRAMRRHMMANALRPGEEGLVHGAFSYVSNTGARTELTDGLFGRTV
ncbi:hypothetical protein CF328_g8553, partial [Tilletia controversa]